MERDLADFTQHLRFERRLSPHTVMAYQRDLDTLMAHAQSLQIPLWSALKAGDLRTILSTLHRAGQSARSLHRFLSATRSFYRFLQREGRCTDNPALSVQAPKLDKPLPATLDVDQISALLDRSPPETDLSMRDHAMIELFYSSGLRLAELHALNVLDLDLAQQIVHIRAGKGNKDRQVPIGRAALVSLKRWLAVRALRPLQAPNALFVSHTGARLGMRSIQQRLKQWGKRQGVTQNLHPHRLRHAFASHVLESSGDLRAVQEYLGHADISTTQVYTHLDFQHLARVYDAAHPRAKKS